MQGASIDHKTQYLEIQSSFGPTITDVRGPRLLVIWENSSRTSRTLSKPCGKMYGPNQDVSNWGSTCLKIKKHMFKI